MDRLYVFHVHSRAIFEGGSLNRGEMRVISWNREKINHSSKGAEKLILPCFQCFRHQNVNILRGFDIEMLKTS